MDRGGNRGSNIVNSQNLFKMNIVQFLFTTLRSFLHSVEPNTMQEMIDKAQMSYEGSEKVQKIMGHWVVMLLLAVAAPFVTKWVSGLLDRLNDVDGDGDKDINDLLLALVRKRNLLSGVES